MKLNGKRSNRVQQGINPQEQIAPVNMDNDWVFAALNYTPSATAWSVRGFM